MVEIIVSFMQPFINSFRSNKLYIFKIDIDSIDLEYSDSYKWTFVDEIDFVYGIVYVFDS